MPPRKTYLCTGLLGLMLLPPAPAVSAETLEAAWNSAINNNHQLKSVKNDTDASEQQLRSAQGQRLPELNVGSAYTQYSETPAAQTRINDQTLQFNTSQSGSVNAQAIASLPVYTSGRISHNIHAAEASLEASRHHENATQLNLKMQVAEAYVAVLRSESALQLAQGHIASLTAHAGDVGNLFEQGMIARNDVLAADVELANARQRAVQVNNQLAIARAHYNRLLDRDLNDSVKLAHQFPTAPNGGISELSAQALAERPELAVLSEQVNALEQQAQSVKAGALPQVSVNGGYQYQENRYQAFQGLWMVNAGVQWKLYDGSTQHQSDAMKRQAIALKEQRDDLGSQIALQVKQAWLDGQETQQRLAVAGQTIAQAEENMKVTTDRYQQGLSTNTDVLKAEELRMSAHDNLNNATYDAILAALHLRYAVGVL
ncbi:MAG: TolC family protein [Methylovulum sp.]|nr:MAG: TolC family protein [Methylovulum sp.]